MKNPFRTLAAVMIVGCSVSQAALAFDSLNSIRDRGVIRIANTQSSPPWSYLDENNQADGYDVAMAKEVARRLDISRVEFVADTFQNFVQGLKTDKYDLVMNDLTPTEARKKQVDFASPYGVEEFYIFVRDDNDEIHGIEDMSGHSVGVTSGTSNEAWARKHMTDSEIKTYSNGGLVFNDLAIGRVDTVLSSLFGGQKHRDVDDLPIHAVGKPLTYQLSAPAMAQGNDSLRNAVSQAIDAMVADGTVEKYAKQYIGADYHMLEGIAAAKAELAAGE